MAESRSKGRRLKKRFVRKPPRPITGGALKIEEEQVIDIQTVR